MIILYLFKEFRIHLMLNYIFRLENRNIIGFIYLDRLAYLFIISTLSISLVDLYLFDFSIYYTFSVCLHIGHIYTSFTPFNYIFTFSLYVYVYFPSTSEI